MSTKNKGIIAFLVLSFGIAWLVWGIAWLVKVPSTSLIFQLVSLPAGFAPAIAAIIVRKWVTREGFADAGLRPHFRRNWRYYLIAWLLPVVVTGLILAIISLTGIAQPDYSFQRGLSQLYPGVKLPAGIQPLLVLQLLLNALLTTPILWGEEFGWRSYLQIRLLSERPLYAALATGVIWGIWHYPIIFMGYERYSSPWLGLLIFTLLTVVLSIVFGWLRLRSGTIWTSSLAHAATNAIGGSLTFLLFVGANIELVGYNGLFGTLLLGLLSLWIILTQRLQTRAIA